VRFPVFSARVHPRAGLPLCRKSRSYIEHLLVSGRAYQVDPNNLKAGVQLFSAGMPPAGQDIIKTLGGSNLLPFSRIQDPMQHPHSVNYPIPAVGDHRLRWHYSFMTGERPDATVIQPLS
jgi:hypothetical protein